MSRNLNPITSIHFDDIKRPLFDKGVLGNKHDSDSNGGVFGSTNDFTSRLKEIKKELINLINDLEKHRQAEINFEKDLLAIINE